MECGHEESVAALLLGNIRIERRWLSDEEARDRGRLAFFMTTLGILKQGFVHVIGEGFRT
jgi:hypothetical protein